MTTNWKGGNGQWQVAANWSNGAPTTPQSFAVIDAAGTYTVSIGSGLEYNVGAVRLAGANATLAIAGILDLKNKLTVSKGTLAVSGTIHGGSIVAAGGTIAFNQATLDGVKFLGTLDLATKATTITVKDGLMLRNTAGTGAGAMTLGKGSQINFVGDQTVNGGNWTITGGAVVTTGTLTLGASETVQYKAAGAFGGGDVLANKGNFNIGKTGTLSVAQIANTGKMTVNNGGSLAADTFTNKAGGSVAIYSGSSFWSDHFNNAGTFTADGGSIQLFANDLAGFGTLDITNSTVTLGGIGSVDELNSLTSMLAGHNNQMSAYLSLDNTGNTITLGTPSGFKGFSYGGSITGGTVTITTTLVAGSLHDLTLRGSLNATGGLVVDNVTFTGADGTGAATVNLSGQLSAQNMLGNANFIAADGSSLSLYDGTIESGVNIQALGAFNAGVPGAHIINKGTLEEDGNGKLFKIVTNRFNNIGTISAQDGGKFLVYTRSLDNLSGSSPNFALTGGTYIVGANSSLSITLGHNKNFAFGTLDADVTLNGAGASFANIVGLSAIGAQGTLALENRATLTVASTFTIDGALHLGGSNFTAANITVDAGGQLGGNGTVFGTVANSGTIDAGGILSISQSVTGTGADSIENNATLSFGAAVAAGQTVTFEGTAGTLALGNAGGFAGTIAGFAPGNAIDLINTKASAVTYNAGADTLTVKNKGTVIATLQLSGDYTGDTFGLASDSKGGTEITVSAATPAVHRFIEAVAAFSPSGAAVAGMHTMPDISHLTPTVAAAHAHFGHG